MEQFIKKSTLKQLTKDAINELKIEPELGKDLLIHNSNFPIGSVNFEINDKKYKIEINPSDTFSGGVVGVFRLLNNSNKAKYVDTGNKEEDMKKYISNKNQEEMGDVSSGGDHNKILSTVINTFCKYIIKYQPDIFVFHALNDRRANFYKKIMKLIEKKLKDKITYKLNFAKNPNNNMIEFHLVRDDKALSESNGFFKTWETI